MRFDFCCGDDAKKEHGNPDGQSGRGFPLIVRWIDGGLAACLKTDMRRPLFISLLSSIATTPEVVPEVKSERVFEVAVACVQSHSESGVAGQRV